MFYWYFSWQLSIFQIICICTGHKIYISLILLFGSRLHILRKNIVKIEILLQFKIAVAIFYLNIYENVIYSCDHYSSLQCHMIFRNHNNMLICCSRHISDYHQMLCLIFFYVSLVNRNFKRTAFFVCLLFLIEIFSNIINVFSVTLDQFNPSLMNNSIIMFFLSHTKLNSSTNTNAIWVDIIL